MDVPTEAGSKALKPESGDASSEKAAAKKADPLEKRMKDHERALVKQAERRRQELFGYIPIIFDRTQYASQVDRKRQAPLSLYEDPEFWSLEAPDRRRLELMQPEERVHYGFGPYPADAPHEATLEDQLRSFQCTAAPSLPGVLQMFDRIDNARAVQLPDLTHVSSDADLATAQEVIDEAASALQDELTLFAIEHYGANALLSFAIEGPSPVQDPELVAQGYLYELAASGVPAVVRTVATASGLDVFATVPNHQTAAPSRLEAPRYVDFADSPLFGHAPPASPLLKRRTATPPPLRRSYASPRSFPTFPSLPRAQIYPQPLYHSAYPRPARSSSPAARRFLRPHETAAAIVAGGSPVPPELADLPWGAQMYVKRVRALQEEEERERERATLARRTSFANPVTASTTAPGLFSAPRAPQQHQQCQQHSTLAAPVTTMDPDHGGGGLGLGFGASGLPPTAPAQPPTPMAPAPTPVMIPPREHAWRGAQPW